MEIEKRIKDRKKHAIREGEQEDRKSTSLNRN